MKGKKHLTVEQRVMAQQALTWCAENNGTLYAYAALNSKNYGSIKKCVRQYFPEEMEKYWTPRCQEKAEDGPQAFVLVSRGMRSQPERTVFTASYHGER